MTTAGRLGGSAAGGGTLVIQTAFLGDVVLTTPLLSALSERHGPLDVVTTPAAAPLLETHPAVRRVVAYDKRGANRGARGLRRLAVQLAAERYARAYLPHRSWRSALLAVLAGIPERIGFADTPARWTYTRRVPRPRRVHETERLLALAPSAAAPAVSLGLTPADRAAAADWMQAAGVAPGFVALAPGSIWGTKRWPGYPALAAMLGAPVVVVGGPDDTPLADEIAAAAPQRTRSAAGRLGLRASAALLEEAAVLVTNDSAPLHLATAVATPVVAVFGPTVPEFGFGPLGPDDRVVGVNGLACRPCSRHGPPVCPLGHHRCMRDLDVETVADAVRATLGGKERRALRTRD